MKGTVAAHHRVEEGIAVGGLDMEPVDLGRGDADIAAGRMPGQATGSPLDGQVTTRGLQDKIATSARHPNVTRRGIERKLAGDILDPNVPRGGVDLDLA